MCLHIFTNKRKQEAARPTSFRPDHEKVRSFGLIFSCIQMKVITLLQPPQPIHNTHKSKHLSNIFNLIFLLIYAIIY